MTEHQLIDHMNAGTLPDGTKVRCLVTLPDGEKRETVATAENGGLDFGKDIFADKPLGTWMDLEVL
jgi:hypothetical protein